MAAVDDGTGCIQCSYFSNSVHAGAVPPTALIVRVSASAVPTHGCACVTEPCHKVGCLVSVQGKLHQFRQRRSIAIYRIGALLLLCCCCGSWLRDIPKKGIEDDPNAEAQHILEVIRLTQSVYQRPSPVPAILSTTKA